MRLTDSQIDSILRATRVIFGDDARVSLFGSRIDNDRRGGDIDLLVETPKGLTHAEIASVRSRFVARLWRDMDERKIDVIVCSPTASTGSPQFVDKVRRESQPLGQAPA